MTTVYDVAEKAGVSIATVSRVFNNSDAVSKASKEKVMTAAKALGYTPNLAARSLMIKRTDTIGVVLPDMHGEFFSELVRGIDAGARERGLHMLVSCSHDDDNEMAAVLAAMAGRVDGVIIMSPFIRAEDLKTHIPNQLPVVVVNSNLDSELFPSVNLDNYAGAYQMMAHLIAEGYRHIAVVNGPDSNLDAQQRCQACRDVAAKNPDCQLTVVEGDFTEQGGFDAGVKLAAADVLPDAVFALNDAMAMGCLSAFAEAGIAVPEAIALAGFDDIPMAKYLRPTLSTVHVPISELGSRALEMLMVALAEDQAEPSGERLIAPKLVIRDSSRSA